MYEFNALNNDQKNIPIEVLNEVRELVKDAHVIDFGAGSEKDMHLDFGALDYTRIDIQGVISAPKYGEISNLEEAVTITPKGTPAFIVLFRSFSCLEDEDLAMLKRVFQAHKRIISGIILYDYAVDISKVDEYVVANNLVGSVFEKRAEWYPGRFFHYHPQQVIEFFGLKRYRHLEVSVPAMKNQSSPGFLIIPEV